MFHSEDNLNNNLSKLYESLNQTIQERIASGIRPYTNYSYSLPIDAPEILRYVSIKDDIHNNIEKIIQQHNTKIQTIYQVSEILPNSPITCYPSEKQLKYKPFVLVFYFSFG